MIYGNNSGENSNCPLYATNTGYAITIRTGINNAPVKYRNDDTGADVELVAYSTTYTGAWAP
jgi:hypothetical protein